MGKDTIIQHFQQLYEIIQKARTKALHSVNFEQLNLFWQVGAFVDQISDNEVGKIVVSSKPQLPEMPSWLENGTTI